VGQAWKMQGLPSLVTSAMPSGLARGAEVVGLFAALVILVIFISACRGWPTSLGDVGMWACCSLDHRLGIAASGRIRPRAPSARSALPAGTSRHPGSARLTLRTFRDHVAGACRAPPFDGRAMAFVSGWGRVGRYTDSGSLACVQELRLVDWWPICPLSSGWSGKLKPPLKIGLAIQVFPGLIRWQGLPCVL